MRDLSRALGRGAAPPARTAAKIDPSVIPGLAASLRCGCALVTGTRGTTTTTRIIAGAARSAGLSVITNRAGSLAGIATALVASSARGGALQPDNAVIGVFEVDEGALPRAIEALGPRLVVITNLFRDRFIARLWQPALRDLATGACVVLNADDPAVAYLGDDLPARVVYFGLADRQWARPGLDRAAGSRRCPRCGRGLRYELSFYAHLGHYACPDCGWRRPDPKFEARRVDLPGAEGSRCQVSTPAGDRTLELPLAGLGEVSDALAATAGASCLGVGPDIPVTVPRRGVAGCRQPMDIDAIAAEVAAAVGLAEGEAGVRDVMRVIARHEPAPTGQISREAELPVPIVTAVCNELRKRAVVDSSRPVRLTPEARELIGERHLAVECPGCGGLGLRAPGELAPLAAALEQAAAGAPRARMELDQSHCTVSTKIHRVLRLHQAGALEGKNILLLGDDDLICVAITRFVALAGAAPRLVTVIDADPEVLGWIGELTSQAPVRVRLIEHDLRMPLPGDLAGAFDVACTDPPYTEAGAELFLSRAVDALARKPGQHLFFSYGARRPAQALATQRLIASLGLVIRSLAPNFNSYVGAGILAGSSHLYHLRTTEQTTPRIEGEYAGPLYTADARVAQDRPYRCARCGAAYLVGRSAAAGWAQIAQLRAAGCPACGGTRFLPGQRLPGGPTPRNPPQ